MFSEEIQMWEKEQILFSDIKLNKNLICKNSQEYSAAVLW